MFFPVRSQRRVGRGIVVWLLTLLLPLSLAFAGGGSSDESAGTLFNMFDFSHPRNHRLFLDPSTGQSTERDGDGDDD